MGKAFGMMACTTLVAAGLWLTNGGETPKTATAGIERSNTPPTADRRPGDEVGYSPAFRSTSRGEASLETRAVRGQSPDASEFSFGNSSAGEVPHDSPEKRKAIELLRAARQEIQAGRFDQARQKALAAKALPVKYTRYEDRPELVLNDIDRRSGTIRYTPSEQNVVNADAQFAPGQSTNIQQTQFDAEFKPSDSPAKQQATALLAEGRAELRAGNYAKAREKALAARQFDVAYSTFEDTPEILLGDLDQVVVQSTIARQPAADPQAANAHSLVRDARRAFNAGNFDEAYQKAIAAQKFDATYDVVDDRPESVLMDIDRAMAGQSSAKTNDIAAKTPSANPFASAGAGADAQARALVKEARIAMQAGRYEEAWDKASAAQRMNVAYDVFEENPEMILAQLEKMTPAAQPTAPKRDTAFTNSSFADSEDPNAQARVLVRQARNALENGDYVLARQKALMADKLGATFGPVDDRPELILSQLDRMARPTPQRTADQSTFASNANISPVYPASMTAEQFYNLGMSHMQQGNQPAAREAFTMAYRQQEQLDPRRRQNLQDYLRELTPRSPQGLSLVSSQEVGAVPPGTLDVVEQQRAIQYDRLRSEVMNAVFRAERLKESDPDQALTVLDQALANVESSDLGDEAAKNLVNSIRRSQSSISAYQEQQAPLLEMRRNNQETLDIVKANTERKIRIEQELATFVEEYNKLINERRYAEAEQVAKQARELDPENPVSVMMVEKAKLQRRIAANNNIRETADENHWRVLHSVEESLANIPVHTDPYVYDLKRWDEVKGRKDKWGQDNRNRTESEKRIEESLTRQVSLHFENATLGDVMKHISGLMNISVAMDGPGLSEVGVETSQPISIDVDGIMLKSALNLMLSPLDLGYSIEDEVLKVTNRMRQQGKMILVTYPVADLVVPLGTANSTIFQPNGFQPTFDPIGTSPSSGIGVLGAGPVPGMNTLGGMQFQVNDTMSGFPGLSNPRMGSNSSASSQHRTAQGNFGELSDLITRTVQPDSWDEVNGDGTVMASETTLSLVIRQTQKVHDEIADLLGQLRRLQDLQVTLEVRFIVVQDDFFERIGIDFDFNIQDTVNESQGLPAFGSPSTATTQNQNQNQNQQQAASTGFDPLNIARPALDNWGRPTVVGVKDSSRSFTDDLDIGFQQGSFDIGIPEFGGFTPNSGAQVGFAILSDIEAFFFIQAAQGDRRTNTMFAPKVTLFNGQAAAVNDFTARPFVVGYQPVVGFGAIGFQPIIRQIPDGLNVGVAAVISADRRYVRLSVFPQFTSITEVSTFQVPTGSTGAVGVVGANQQQQQGSSTGSATIQQPVTAIVSVQTTVSVPDGGTVLLGGVKRLREGRTMQGVPILNKLPYISRLFKNTGVGRETESLMLMVTPRIIIQEEEEELLGLAL